MTVDREFVRRKLLQEQRAWEEERLALDCNEAQTLQIWSVGKLLRAIEACESPHTLAQYGITRHLVGSDDTRRFPSQEAAEAASAVTYTSSHLWLTGFLKFRDEDEDYDTLHLCDTSTELKSFLLDPNPQLVDQLVLVKNWVLVDKALRGVREADSLFLEVHDKNPVMLQPLRGVCATWDQQKALAVLEANYPTKDPPMYIGTQPWDIVVRAQDNASGEYIPSVVTVESNMPAKPGKSKKRKRVHAVFGRVTCVSPISRQKDCESSHFFVEIEQFQRDGRSMAQSVVSVMFAGVQNVRWHLFMRPRKIVLLSDLVKVFSQECGMFLLQTTNNCVLEDRTPSTEMTLRTSVLVWKELSPPQQHSILWNDTSLDGGVKDVADRFCGKLLDYTGRVGKVLWDECIELNGIDGSRVVVCLFRFPCANELARLRKGTTVRIFDAHVLRWPSPVGGKLVIGLCPRSHLDVISYGTPLSPCILARTVPHANRSKRKWQDLGDFRRQSMTLSMWLLELLELLSAKLNFATDASTCSGLPVVLFQTLRRRHAVARVAEKLGVLLDDSYKQEAETLGAIFLKCHARGANSCMSTQLPSRELLLMCSRVATISELQAFGTLKLEQTTKSKSDSADGSGGRLSVRISRSDLEWCLLVGCIQGGFESGNLEICDRTGAIPLHVIGNPETSIPPHGGRGVYLIRDFELLVENFNTTGESEGEMIPLIYCISCSSSNVQYISMDSGDGNSYSQESRGSTEVSEEQEVLAMITDVDVLLRSSVRASAIYQDYRVMHALILPVDHHFQTEHFIESAYCAELLVNTKCVNWYVKKYCLYRVKVIPDNNDNISSAQPRHISVELALKTSGEYLRSLSANELCNAVCFDSMQHFRPQRRGKVDIKTVSYPVFRIEDAVQPIIPVKLEYNDYEEVQCGKHEMCRRSDRDDVGALTAPARREDFAYFDDSKELVKRAISVVSTSELVAISAFRYFLLQSEPIAQVGTLLVHSLQEPMDDNVDSTARTTERIVDPSLHKSHSISIIGIVTKKKYYWKLFSRQQPQSSSARTVTIGMKRPRDNSGEQTTSVSVPNRRLACVIHVRDLHHMDTVQVSVDASRFGVLSTIQLNNVVEFTRLQGNISRSGYKVYLNWCESTLVRSTGQDSCALVPLDSELYGSMPTTFLNDLYYSSYVDRRLHRYVVDVAHMSYVVLKRRCIACYRVLQLDKRRGCWMHSQNAAGSSSYRECAWRRHLSPSDPAFKARTYMSTTVRCMIDDGSGQGELFLENDVAWELFACTDGQRLRFEEILSSYVDELSYFSGNAGAGSFATSKAQREKEYYQNELQNFVVSSIPSLGSLAVIAQRFYKSSTPKEGTSVLTFGKDIQMTTKTAPIVKLEAKRVDRVHVRSELQNCLARLRAMQMKGS